MAATTPVFHLIPKRFIKSFNQIIFKNTYSIVKKIKILKVIKIS